LALPRPVDGVWCTDLSTAARPRLDKEKERKTVTKCSADSAFCRPGVAVQPRVCDAVGVELHSSSPSGILSRALVLLWTLYFSRFAPKEAVLGLRPFIVELWSIDRMHRRRKNAGKGQKPQDSEERRGRPGYPASPLAGAAHPPGRPAIRDRTLPLPPTHSQGTLRTPTCLKAGGWWPEPPSTIETPTH
jgi:hypothetical protein